ncbi:MAG: hypothetical protein AAF845_15905 [Bacteroidota bacterium]
MPFCSRCGLAGLVLLVLAFTGCDTNNPGRDIDNVAGQFSLAEITFDPEANALSDVDVDATLNLNSTRLEIFNDDEEAQLVIAFSDGRTRRVNLRADASRTQVRLEAVEDEDVDDLALLLLPRSFSLGYTGERATRLDADLDRSGVDLEAFDSDRYQGLTDVRGTLIVSFER